MNAVTILILLLWLYVAAAYPWHFTEYHATIHTGSNFNATNGSLSLILQGEGQNYSIPVGVFPQLIQTFKRYDGKSFLPIQHNSIRGVLISFNATNSSNHHSTFTSYRTYQPSYHKKNATKIYINYIKLSFKKERKVGQWIGLIDTDRNEGKLHFQEKQEKVTIIFEYGAYFWLTSGEIKPLKLLDISITSGSTKLPLSTGVAITLIALTSVLLGRKHLL
jgi:hypothetical protein